MDDQAEVTVPTACTLDTAQARERVARWRELAERTQPMVTQSEPNTVQLRYPRSPDVIADLSSLAELESECCAFLTFAVQETGDDVTLTIEPAAGAAPDIAPSLAMLTSLITGHLC
jgi:hypothetical protein